MKSLFKDKNFALLFTGSFVSEMGNVLFGFAAGLYVQVITDGSALLLALFMALGAAVRLAISPLAGVLVDKWNKVRIIYLTDFFRGIMFILVAYIFMSDLTNQEATNILLIVTVISGVVSAFFGPAVTSAIPEIVGLDKVQQANGASSIIQSSTMIMGVVMGAAAFSLFDFHVALFINGISFLLSGFSEMFIRSPHKKEIPHDENFSMLEDFKVGFRYLRNKEGLLTMMVFSLFLNFAFSPLFSVGIPFLFKTELDKSAWDLAWQNIAFGVAMMISGVFVGSMVIKNITGMIRRSLLLLTSSFLFATLIIYLGSIDIINYPTFYVLLLFTHISMATFMIATNVPLNTSMVKVIDAEVRGRVFSTIGAISGGAVPIAIFLGGVVIQVSSVAFLGVICAALILIPTYGFMTNKKVRNLLETMDEDINGQLQEAI